MFQGLVSELWGDEGKLFTNLHSGLHKVATALVKSSVPHSKLAFLSDKACKTRVVAIGDVITQCLMKPVHTYLFNILRKLECDGTFEQDIQRERVREATRGNLKLFSIDMKSCTDRLPLVFIMMALHFSGCMSKEQSTA